MRCAGATREAETEAIVCTVEGATGMDSDDDRKRNN